MGAFRRVLVAACVAASLAASLPVRAQTWPDKPIKLIVPFAPGGGNDILGRIVSVQLTRTLGQAVVVDNRPGAGGNIGAGAAAKSAPDGYTFLVAAHQLFAVNPLLSRQLPFDPVKDFDPVGLVGELPLIVVVHPDVPAKTIADLIALAKAKPQSLAYGSAGTASPHHLGGELFNALAGTTLVHVPYKGGAPAATDLLAGRVQVMFAPINNVFAQVKEGRVRVLASAMDRRLPQVPDAPTVAEAGVPGYRMENWIGIVAPAGTPKPIVTRLNQELEQMLARAEVREQLAAQGISPRTATPERMRADIEAEIPRWAAIIRNAGIRPE